jgi:hypothetical protein
LGRCASAGPRARARRARARSGSPHNLAFGRGDKGVETKHSAASTLALKAPLTAVWFAAMTRSLPRRSWSAKCFWRSVGLHGYATLAFGTAWSVAAPANPALAKLVMAGFVEFAAVSALLSVGARRFPWGSLGAAVCFANIVAWRAVGWSVTLLPLALLTAVALAATYLRSRTGRGTLAASVGVALGLFGLLLDPRNAVFGLWLAAMPLAWLLFAWSSIDTRRFEEVALAASAPLHLRQAFRRQMTFARRWYRSTRFGEQVWRVVAALVGLSVVHAALLGSMLTLALVRDFGVAARDPRLGWFVAVAGVALSIVVSTVPMYLLLRPVLRWARHAAFALDSWSLLQDPVKACRVWTCLGEHRDKRYAVYLRSFAAEQANVLWFGTGQRGTAWLPQRYLVPRLESGSREPDWTLAQIVAKHMPIFALGNRFDPVPPDDLGCLYSDNATWFQKFRLLVDGAALVVVYLTEESQGLAEELSVLSEARFREHTLIIATSRRLVERAQALGFRRLLLDTGATDYAKLLAEPSFLELLNEPDEVPESRLSQASVYVGDAGVGEKAPWASTICRSRVRRPKADLEAHRDICTASTARLLGTMFKHHPTSLGELKDAFIQWAPSGRWENIRCELREATLLAHCDQPFAPVFAFIACRQGHAPDGSAQLYRPGWLEAATPRTDSFEAIPLSHPMLKPSA